jgi:hypothetical protein
MDWEDYLTELIRKSEDLPEMIVNLFWDKEQVG